MENYEKEHLRAIEADEDNQGTTQADDDYYYGSSAHMEDRRALGMD